ncbi:MAG: hypothetical protein AABX12_05465 [Nanoarchaeota archaeon]
MPVRGELTQHLGGIEPVSLRRSDGVPRDEALVSDARKLFDDSSLEVSATRFGRHVIVLGGTSGEYAVTSHAYHGEGYADLASAFHEFSGTLGLNPGEMQHDASRGLAGFMISYAAFGDDS